MWNNHQYNRGGGTSGYEETNTAVSPGFFTGLINHGIDLKSIESTRRPTFVVGAPAKWCVRQGAYGPDSVVV